MITGGCFCGRVRYEIDDGDYVSANCHCSMCRRVHAAPYVSWLVVPARHFRYTGELPQAFRSSGRGTRFFCQACGNPLTCIVDAHPDVMDVALGGLDAPEAHPPTVEVHTDTRLPWCETGLPTVG